MNPTTTNVEERDQWRARINRALAELLPSDLSHIDGRVTENADAEMSGDADAV